MQSGGHSILFFSPITSLPRVSVCLSRQVSLNTGHDGALFAVVVLELLDGRHVARPAAATLDVLGGAAGRHAAAAADAAVVGGEEAARGGGVEAAAAADADAAVVVLLEAGLQLGHLGHRGRRAGGRNTLKIGERD